MIRRRMLRSLSAPQYMSLCFCLLLLAFISCLPHLNGRFRAALFVHSFCRSLRVAKSLDRCSRGCHFCAIFGAKMAHRE
jgi:hypothetical protein